MNNNYDYDSLEESISKKDAEKIIADLFEEFGDSDSEYRKQINKVFPKSVTAAFDAEDEEEESDWRRKMLNKGYTIIEDPLGEGTDTYVWIAIRKGLVEDLKESISIPENMVKDYTKRAEAEYASGGSVEINNKLETIAVTCSNGSEYFFQGDDASVLLDEVPYNMNAQDYIMAISQGW